MSRKPNWEDILRNEKGKRKPVENPNRPITDDELKRHNKKKDGWMVLKGKVFDVSDFVDYHPGGEQNIMKGVGTDATALFNKAHSYVHFENILVGRQVGIYQASSSAGGSSK